MAGRPCEAIYNNEKCNRESFIELMCKDYNDDEKNAEILCQNIETYARTFKDKKFNSDESSVMMRCFMLFRDIKTKMNKSNIKNEMLIRPKHFKKIVTNSRVNYIDRFAIKMKNDSEVETFVITLKDGTQIKSHS